jgi:hypothetical protein
MPSAPPHKWAKSKRHAREGGHPGFCSGFPPKACGNDVQYFGHLCGSVLNPTLSDKKRLEIEQTWIHQSKQSFSVALEVDNERHVSVSAVWCLDSVRVFRKLLRG